MAEDHAFKSWKTGLMGEMKGIAMMNLEKRELRG